MPITSPIWKDAPWKGNFLPTKQQNSWGLYADFSILSLLYQPFGAFQVGPIVRSLKGILLLKTNCIKL